jgi:hypothetical protein
MPIAFNATATFASETRFLARMKLWRGTRLNLPLGWHFVELQAADSPSYGDRGPLLLPIRLKSSRLEGPAATIFSSIPSI